MERLQRIVNPVVLSICRMQHVTADPSRSLGLILVRAQKVAHATHLNILVTWRPVGVNTTKETPVHTSVGFQLKLKQFSTASHQQD